MLPAAWASSVTVTVAIFFGVVVMALLLVGCEARSSLLMCWVLHPTSAGATVFLSFSDRERFHAMHRPPVVVPLPLTATELRAAVSAERRCAEAITIEP